MHSKYTHNTTKEHRLIAFNEAKETSQSEKKSDNTKTLDATFIDALQVHSDVEAVINRLKNIEADLSENDVKDFRKKLENIQQKFKKLDENKIDDLREAAKEMYRELSPFLENAAKQKLNNCKNLQNPSFEKAGMNFTLDGEKMKVEITELYEVRSVQVLGATIQFQKPIHLELLDDRVGQNALNALRLAVKRFDLRGLVVMGTEARFEFTIKEKGEEKRYVASSQDVLEVKQSPSPEKMKEWMDARKMTADLTKAKGAAWRGMCDLFEGKDMKKEIMQLERGMEKMGGESQIDTSKFTPEQKKQWDACQSLQEEISSARDKELALQSECGARSLQAKDGTKVQEKGDPRWSDSFKWIYLDDEGKKQTELNWSMSRYTDKTEYDKGEEILHTDFRDTGIRESVTSFREGTTDRYDEKGRRSHRVLFDPKESDTIIGTQMCDMHSRRLIDEKTLQSMTLEQIETFFLQLLLPKEDDQMRSESIDACYTAVKYIIKCPRGEEILRKLARNNPEDAFMNFGTFKDVPYAISILEEASYAMAYSPRIEQVFKDNVEISKLPEDVKNRILGMANRKEHNQYIADLLTADFSKPDVQTLLADSSLQNITDVKEEWIDWDKLKSPGFSEKIWNIQIRAMIARNLYFQNLKVNEESVEGEFLRIVETRDLYKNVSVFKDRNVLHFAHSEMIRDLKDGEDGMTGKNYPDEFYEALEFSTGDTHRFGKKGTQEAIKKQQDGKGTYEIIRPEKQIEAILKAKEDIIQKIKTLPPPSTFIFDGHGGEDTLYLSDGTVGSTAKINTVHETDMTVKITVDELAQALIERAQKFPQLKTDEPHKKDIFIFACCYNSNFIRNLYEQIGDIAKPIALGSSEYGQYGYSDMRSKFGSKFFANVLQLEPLWKATLKRDGEPTTISDVFNYEHIDDSNPSLYIPDEKNLPMQITKIEGEDMQRDGSEKA